MKKALVLVAVLLLLLSMVLLVACGQSTSTTSSTGVQTTATSGGAAETTAAPAAEETLKIGIFETAQGAIAAWGQGIKDVTQMQVDAVNAEGGLLVGGKRYKFEVIFYETGHDAAKAVPLIQKGLQQDHINFVFEGGTPPDSAMAPYTVAAKVIMIGGSNDPVLYGKNPYMYNVIDTPQQFSDSFFPVIKEKEPTWKSFARISVDVAYDKAGSAADQKAIKDNGLTYLGEAMVQPGTTDFSAAVTKAMGMHPDAIVFGEFAGQSADVIRAIREAGWKGGILSTITGDAATDQLAAFKGQESYIDGYYQGEIGWYPIPPEMVKFQDEFLKATGQSTYNPQATRTWWMAAVLFQALQDAGTVSDPDAISAAIEKVQIAAPYAPGNPVASFGGKETYGRNSQLQVPFGITHFENGQPLTVQTGILEVK